MKGRVVLLDERAGRRIAALVVDGRLDDLLIDPPENDATPRPGEIYWAKVERTVPSIGGAFVKLTPKHQGFLRGAKGLREGEYLLVQVASFPESGKATPVSSRILYKSRRIIHTLGAPGINVSRQIKDKVERERLTKVVATTVASLPAETKANGWIIRSASESADPEDLSREVMAVSEVASNWPPEGGEPLNAPVSPIYRSSSQYLALEEWTFPVPQSVVAPLRIASELSNYVLDEFYPDPNLYAAVDDFDGPDLLDHYGVWDEVERLKSARADLTGAAWMSVEPTRAMVSVDVNTGEDFGKGAALKANLAAAAELPRQLRLRGLGGIVTVDFAPASKRERPQIEAALRRALAADPVQTDIAGWTPLGQLQLQRKRERRPLNELLEGL